VDIRLKPIGVVHSCFKEKFGIPRQPGLVPDARADLELLPPFNRQEAVRGIEAFSHLWIIFLFHAAAREDWKPTVRPPRLGGNRRIGVFASRSMFRPNPVGMSAVALESVDCSADAVRLKLKGIDILDGTPVLDIKPYLPYADAIAGAAGGFAPDAPPTSLEVEFSPEACRQCRERQQAGHRDLKPLITQILRTDPRPAYHARVSSQRTFGMKLLDVDVQWRVAGNKITVEALVPKPNQSTQNPD